MVVWWWWQDDEFLTQIDRGVGDLKEMALKMHDVSQPASL